MKICFAASSGGHFEQLMMLRHMMEKYDAFVVTEKTAYLAKADIPMFYLFQVNRKEKAFPLKMFVNTFYSFMLLLREKPDAVITTGVLAMVPLCLLAKVMGKKLIYIESFAKVTSATESGKLLYRYADRFYVQWPQMKDIYPAAICVGGIY